MEKAYLILQDGTTFEGERIGDAGNAVGELVFTTGMVGYTETLTDPSYAGQIVLQTFPLIGNYGLAPEDFEGKTAARGYVVRECCSEPSNFRARMTLNEFLCARHIPGIAGVDTREITRLIRKHGVMNAVISSTPKVDLEAVRAYRVTGVVPSVSCAKNTIYKPEGKFTHTVVLVDYGAKENIVRNLTRRGCRVIRVPENTTAEEILALSPDGVMLSNGPGDPTENTAAIAELKKLIGKVPVFGICLGHQLAALAMGGKTVKLPFGHRGGNQPVREVGGARTYITSQNHGYAVVSSTLQGVGRELYVNANDGSCEGMEYPGKRCFTVQFHPEACGGPHDTEFLFDRFIAMMGGENHAEG
ncbi:MAG: glutamine-hydrolyzing carbamoyl-phosphate synthase small subunit [Clostridia bacterium]|nr:glutamine-hydrolyzing carbamoyl-phosphate synthase small subunit [Clostridia bacterium]